MKICSICKIEKDEIHNLPELKPSNIVEGREQKIWKMPPSKNRKELRSKTFLGIGDAMAKQWGNI